MKVVGTRSPILWLSIVVAVVVVAGVLFVVLVLLPQRSAGQHYRAGLAFETAEEWEAAKQEYVQVIAIDAGYKDTQARLAEVKARLAESVATSTATAMTEQARVDAQATVEAAHTPTPTSTPRFLTISDVNFNEFPKARVLVTVQDENGVPIYGLRNNEFEIVEDGKVGFPPSEVEIANQQYILTYQSTLPKDANPHSLLIRIQTPQDQTFGETKLQIIE